MQDITTHTDKELEKEVQAQLKWDTRLADAGIMVDVQDEKVTLTGTVPSYADRLFAEKDAQVLFGVQEVINKLMITPPQGSKLPSTAEMRSNAESILKWASHIDSDNIAIDVQDKHVILSGTVPAYWQIFRAEQLISQIWGVAGITNKLAVVATDSPGDRGTADDIMDALNRNATIDVEDVDVQVDEGNVLLSGVVSNLEAYHTAYDIARFTYGVTDVVNLLTVQSD